MSYQPHLGDILNVNFSPSQGHEQQGYRPAVVVSHHIMAQTSPFIWVVPISHGKWQYPMHVSLDSRTKTDGTIFVEQLLTIDYRHRDIEYVETLPLDLLKDVLHNIHEMTSI